MQSELNPVSAGERIRLLDILRGFAIFGILTVNMQVYHNPVSLWLTNGSGSHTFPDILPESFIRLLFEGKFYVLFSLLFGYGFWLFFNRSHEDERKIMILFIRRLIILLGIGIFHVVFLWAGDMPLFCKTLWWGLIVSFYPVYIPVLI